MKYLTAVANRREELTAYLGFSAAVTVEGQTHKGRTAAIVTCEERDAEWQSARFSSGLMGGRIFDTYDEASITLQDLLELC